MSERRNGRAANALRTVRFTRHFTRHAEGSVLIEFGDTRVLCTASIEEKVPPFLRGKGEGWVTAEYGMLPRRDLPGGRPGRRLLRNRQDDIRRRKFNGIARRPLAR